MMESIISWAKVAYSPTALWASASIIFFSYFFWLIAERIYPAEKGQKLALMGYNFFITLVYIIGTPLATYVAGSIATSFVQGMTDPLISLELSGWATKYEGWLRLVVLILLLLVPILIYDFFYYWFHRAQHTWPWFWYVHKLHHTDEALNVTTSYRHHWTEEFFRSIGILAPMGLLFSITPAEGGFLSIVLGQWGHFVHTNTRIRLGLVGLVIAGPQYHRIHHSIKRKHWNKNFAAFFPFWDILFGTANVPAHDEWPQTGVKDETSTPTIGEAIFGPFLAWTRSVITTVPYFGQTTISQQKAEKNVHEDRP